MDARDVSNKAEFLDFFRQLKANAERAAQRKGETPRDHPLPQVQIEKFMMSRLEKKLQFDLSSSAEGKDVILRSSHIPAPYAPSVRLVHDLQPLMISDMQLETHHRGKKVLIHVMTPPDRLTAVMAIAEDEEGTAVLLQLYNQPEEDEVHESNILEEHDIFIIKEPYFKVATSGQYSLRVDHVSDVIRLGDDDERIPRKWRQYRSSRRQADSQQLRSEGNLAVKRKNWDVAERLYSYAIHSAVTREQDMLAHLNRSLANLKLDRPEKALEDAVRGGGSPQRSEKGLFREAKALYTLNKYDSCLQTLQAMVASYPNNKEGWSDIERVKQRLREQKTGAYNFRTMQNQAKTTPPIIDCATYVGNVAIRPSPGYGRGLFTTHPVKAGELLLCEKAIAYSYAGNDDPIGSRNQSLLVNMSTNTMTLGGQAYLISQAVQKLYHNPDSASAFKELYHGDYQPVTVAEVDGKPIVDTFLVAKIINLNCFGAPRSSIEKIGPSVVAKAPAGHTTCGIWCLASHINHSCVSNCHRAFIGDVQIVRASQDLDANTELVFQYQQTTGLQTYNQTQRRLSNWGFECTCKLCLEKKFTPDKMLKKRQNLSLEFQTALWATQFARAKTLLKQISKTYSARKGVPHLELSIEYLQMGTILYEAKDNLTESISFVLKSLEALGYNIVACPPGNTSNEPVFEVTAWGQSHEHVVMSFLVLARVYKTVAPQLCTAARRCAEMAYTMNYGEKESFGASFPYD